MPRASILINRPSDSARALANALTLKRVRPERLAYLRPRLVINWGCSLAENYGNRFINRPEVVLTAKNKVLTFDLFNANQVSIPKYATLRMYRNEGINWDGITLARLNVTGSGGDGIVVVREGDVVPEAPLYVEYIRKNAEYRVHVVRGEAICVQQKRKREGVEQDRNSALIRNYDNGWVFAVNNVEFANEDVKSQVVSESIKAVQALGLDFGAVDVIVNREGTKAYVLEVNTAPGIESPTVLEAYRTTFTRIINES